MAHLRQFGLSSDKFFFYLTTYESFTGKLEGNPSSHRNERPFGTLWLYYVVGAIYAGLLENKMLQIDELPDPVIHVNRESITDQFTILF
jgi:hypothetical protein